MNIYEDENIDPKLDELTDLLDYLVLDLLLVNLRKVVKENQILPELSEAKHQLHEQDGPI